MTNNNIPVVSFITICYNGYKDTFELIESIQKYITSVNYEIIVVDNASKINEASLLQKKFPSIISVRSEINLGFSGGNNLGLKKAKGSFMFFINNDTFIINDKLNILIDTLNNNPRIAALSPKIRYAASPHYIQYAGYTPLSAITIRNKTIANGETDNGSFDKPIQTPYLHGAAMLVKSEIIDKVGVMPELFFLYYEELDWSTQMTDAHYELWYSPEWTVYHKESQSTGVQSKLQIYYMTRNRLLYAWRHRKGLNKWLSIIYQVMIAAPKNCAQFILNKKFDLAGSTIKGIHAFIFMKDKLK